MAKGKATLLTPVAAQGIELDPFPASAVTDDPPRFAQEVVRALTDRDYRTRLADQGVEIIRQNYNSERVYAPLLAALENSRSDASRPTLAAGV